MDHARWSDLRVGRRGGVPALTPTGCAYQLFDVPSEEIARARSEIPDEPAPAPREIPGDSAWTEPPADGRRRRR